MMDRSPSRGRAKMVLGCPEELRRIAKNGKISPRHTPATSYNKLQFSNPNRKKNSESPQHSESPQDTLNSNKMESLHFVNLVSSGRSPLHGAGPLGTCPAGLLFGGNSSKEAPT